MIHRKHCDHGENWGNAGKVIHFLATNHMVSVIAGSALIFISYTY